MNIDFSQLNPSLDTGLRPYQIEYKTKIYEAWSTKKRIMLQMPTGTGKTKLFVSIIKDLRRLDSIQRPVRILILAHRIELIEQIHKEISGDYDIPSGIIRAGNLESQSIPTQIASVPTLCRDKRIEKWTSFKFDLIIVDEAHHIKAYCYRRIIKTFPEARILGVTATPYRMSGYGFKDNFDELIMSQPVMDFIRQGYLSDYEYYSIPQNTLLQRQIKSIIEYDVDGDYVNRAMMRIMDNKEVMAEIVATYQKYTSGKKGIVYTINQEHNSHVCQKFIEAGIKAEIIDSRTDFESRSRIVQQFRNGEIDVLCNVNIFNEGFDCPDVEFIQLARPTRSLALFLQQVGRGLRPAENKEKVIILDNVGSYNTFGFPTAKHDWQKHFDGYYRLHCPDESTNTQSDDAHQVNIIQIFDEGNEQVNLLYSSVNGAIDKIEHFRSFMDEVVTSQKVAYNYKEAFYNYLIKKYQYGTANNYLAFIPNHLDVFIKSKYHKNFKGLYYLIDPLELNKILRYLINDNNFVIFNNLKRNTPLLLFNHYISFAKEHSVIINRTPEEIAAYEEEQRVKKIQEAVGDKISDLYSGIYNLRKKFNNKEQQIPNEVLEKINELIQVLNDT